MDGVWESYTAFNLHPYADNPDVGIVAPIFSLEHFVHMASICDKMGLQIGDVIRTVNGVQVQTTQQYYEALQLNRAYCKLEVIDDQGENRLVNRALYEGEHHELGVITFEMDSKWEKKVIS